MNNQSRPKIELLNWIAGIICCIVAVWGFINPPAQKVEVKVEVKEPKLEGKRTVEIPKQVEKSNNKKVESLQLYTPPPKPTRNRSQNDNPNNSPLQQVENLIQIAPSIGKMDNDVTAIIKNYFSFSNLAYKTIEANFSRKPFVYTDYINGMQYRIFSSAVTLKVDSKKVYRCDYNSQKPYSNMNENDFLFSELNNLIKETIEGGESCLR